MDYLTKNVKFLAAQRGVSQTGLGKAAGLNQSTVSRIFNGGISATSYVAVQRLAGYFGQTLDDMVCRDIEAGGATARPSQAMKLDPEILSDAFRLLHAFIGIMGLEAESATDPYLLADAYEIASQESAEAQGDSVLSGTKRLADRIRERERGMSDGDERREDQATGRADGNARKASIGRGPKA